MESEYPNKKKDFKKADFFFHSVEVPFNLSPELKKKYIRDKLRD